MTFKKILEELFYDLGEFTFEDLEDTPKRDLMAAYIEENEEIIYDLFANVHETSMAGHFAALIWNRCDPRHIADDIRIAIMGGKDLPSLINGEIDLQWREHEREVYLASADYLEECR